MHELIPHSGWQTHYIADEDINSPLYNNQGAPDNGYYHRMYDFIIHPEWDYIGCETLFVKLIFVDYSQGFAVIELLGEWNDTIHNDIMEFKRRLVDSMIEQGIDKFLLICDNLLNFHGAEDHYYEEWSQETSNGWIVFLNVREQIEQELINTRLGNYIWFGKRFILTSWRVQDPLALCQNIDYGVSLALK